MDLKNLFRWGGLHKIDIKKARHKLPADTDPLVKETLLGLIVWGINAAAVEIFRGSPDSPVKTGISIPVKYLGKTARLVSAWNVYLCDQHPGRSKVWAWCILPLGEVFTILCYDATVDMWQKHSDDLGHFLQDLTEDSKYLK